MNNPKTPKTPKPTPDPRIAAYIAEIETPGIPYFSYSHLTLCRLNGEHGQQAVDALLSDYFLRLRQWDKDNA